MIEQLLKTTKQMVKSTQNKLTNLMKQEIAFEQVLQLNNKDLNEFVKNIKSYSD